MGDPRQDAASTGRYADAALALLLMAIVGMMIVPLPTWLLDILIASNVTLGVLMLLIAMRVSDGLAFTAMPTVLLVTTLYRLALNVSSTRLILLQADAGEVIEAFGEFVVRGNYLVGGVIFAILVLIQYVVVARGSERVAEVGARFSLDAMPGKQMAIDADLRAGALTPDSARRQRRELDRENQFYGAMDGAMKFVKGDAIAGIVITAINLGAGVAIGMSMHELTAAQSLRVYGLLTIGDGLVSQIPSLLTSTSAGLLVTRVASRESASSLGSDIGEQLFGEPRVLAFGASFLALLAVIPGLPAPPFGLLAIVLAALAYGLHRRARERLAASEEAAPARLGVALGGGLATDNGAAERPLARALAEAASAVEHELGLPPLGIALRADGTLPRDAYRLELDHAPLHEARVPHDAEPGAAIAAAVAAAMRKHAAELLGIEETQRLLSRLEEEAPALVRHVVPRPVSVPQLAQVLRRLLAEGVSIRPLRDILEALGERDDGTASVDVRVERVRSRLRRQIAARHAADGRIRVHAVDPVIEDVVRDAITRDGDERFLALPPDEARDILSAVQRVCEVDPRAVLVTQPDVRHFLGQLLSADHPEVAVLSYPELAGELQIERGTPVRVGDAE